MLAQRPEIPAPADGEAIVQLAWPDYLLFDERKRVFGFVMPVLDTRRTIELEYILQSRQAKAQNLPEDWRQSEAGLQPRHPGLGVTRAPAPGYRHEAGQPAFLSRQPVHRAA